MLFNNDIMSNEFNNSKIGGIDMIKEQLQKYNINKLYYMAHIHNIPSILEHGILCYNKARNVKHKSISDHHVQSRRDRRFIEGYRTIHDYVPLYFATHTPMQYVITQNGESPYYISPLFLAFIEVDPIKVFQTPGVVFTDGNSACRETRFFKDMNDLEQIDWDIIKKKRCFSREYKRKKSAEVLIPDRIPVDYFLGIVVFYEKVEEEISNMCSEVIRKKFTKLCKIDTKDTDYYSFRKIRL